MDGLSRREIVDDVAQGARVPLAETGTSTSLTPKRCMPGLLAGGSPANALAAGIMVPAAVVSMSALSRRRTVFLLISVGRAGARPGTDPIR